jgi:hypothetical protein
MLGLSGSSTIHNLCALPALTPEDRTTAHAYAFIVHTGFTLSGRLTILNFISGPNPVHTFTHYGSQSHLIGHRCQGYPLVTTANSASCS